MKKKNIVFGLVTTLMLGITSTALSSCGEDHSSSSSPTISSSESMVAVAIKIYGPLSATKYYQGASVDYSKLQIQTLTASGKIVETLAYSQNQDKITHTDIDTSTVATGRVFSVSYKANENAVEMTANINYDVLINDLTPIGWHANKRWTDFVSEEIKDIKTSPDGTHPSNFMKSTDYYLGNKNALDLFPIVNGRDHFGNVAVMSSISSGVTVELKDSNGAALALSDYFGESDLANLQTRGLVDFKDDKTGVFTLSFTYPSGAVSEFAKIDYKLTVVDGYNVTTAKELAVMTNSSDATYKTINDPWKAANNIPNIQVDSIVIQNNLTINKADLPPYSIWGKSDLDTQPKSTSCIDTLKDSQWIYGHFLDKDHPTFSLYGNLFKVSCGSDFPYVEETTACDGTHLPEGGVVNSHTALFGSNKYNDYDSASDKSVFKFTIQDLSFTGNTGVSDKPEMKSKGGVIFIKPNSDSLIKNCVISEVFVGTVNDGSYDSPTSYRRYVSTWDSTRIHDTFSAQLFNFVCGDIVIKNCDLYHSGGPLFINQAPSVNLAGLSETDASKIPGSWIRIDSNSSLDNYVSGTGGWFDIYDGATALVAQLKGLNPAVMAASSKTFLALSGPNQDKFNFISLNMSTGEGVDQTKSSGLFGGTVIAEENPVDYNGGRDVVLAGVNSAQSDGGASFAASLFSTDSGALFVSQNKPYNGVCPPVFKMNKDFLMPTADAQGNITGLANVKYYVTGLEDDKKMSPDGKTAKYLGIYGFGNADGLSVDPMSYMTWGGSNDFGLVIALSSVEASA